MNDEMDVNNAPNSIRLPALHVENGAQINKRLSKFFWDIDGDALTYFLESPSGQVVLDRDSGILSGYLSSSTKLRVIAEDGNGAETRQTLDIIVN